MTFDGSKNRNISSENKGQVLLVIPFYDQREEPPLGLLQILTQKRDCYHAKFNGLKAGNVLRLYSHFMSSLFERKFMSRTWKLKTPFHSKVQ